MKQIVYVVMCNDCVSRVFSTEAVAKAFVDKHEAEEIEVENSRQWGYRRRIFWRYYPFTLDEDMMTGEQLKAARYAISHAVGEKVSQSYMADLCGLLDPGRNGKDTIRKWEDGDGPTGPVSAMVRLILEGVTHTNPAVRGFFINYVRERPRDVPF